MNKILINSAMAVSLVGSCQAVTPEELLANGQDTTQIQGVTVRKGSIAALMQNVELLNASLTPEGDRSTSEKCIEDLRAIMPAQHVFKVFDVFQPIEWLDEECQGKVMAAIIYLQQHPERITPEVKHRLRSLRASAHPLVQREIKLLG